MDGRRRILVASHCRDQPFFVLSLLQIAYGGLLVSAEVFPKMHLKYRPNYDYCHDSMGRHTVGTFFIIAGIVLLLVAKPMNGFHRWRLVFASYMVFIAHVISTIWLAVQTYAESYFYNCGPFLALLLSTALGSLMVVIVSILFILHYWYKSCVAPEMRPTVRQDPSVDYENTSA